MKTLIGGTRGSALALWQTEHTVATLRAQAARTGTSIDLAVRIITTRGDTDQSPVLAGKLGKGFFTLELEAALRSGEIDFAVHSLKDLPTESPPDLAIAAVLPRGPMHDLLLVAPDAVADGSGRELPLVAGAKVGSSSLRRSALLKRYSPRSVATPLRGNVPTRLTKLAQGHYQAIVLAAAGVERLGLDLEKLRAFDLNPRVWIPAPGQGAVAVQCRAGDAIVRGVFSAVSHAPTADATAIERLYLHGLEGGCTTPFGCAVDGPDLCLGLDVHGGWRRSIAPLAGADRPRLLANLQAPEYREPPGDEWLYREHRSSEMPVA
ncbi:MAG TPA: hydroxymethylbilane synthase [Steroidobacteraceae bacterium]|nr:hydroxymethylbilane synthase [Steroidobacteraceae bacterium]